MGVNMEVNILSEILFGFGLCLALGLLVGGLRVVMRSFALVADNA